MNPLAVNVGYISESKWTQDYIRFNITNLNPYYNPNNESGVIPGSTTASSYIILIKNMKWVFSVSVIENHEGRSNDTKRIKHKLSKEYWVEAMVNVSTNGDIFFYTFFIINIDLILAIWLLLCLLIYK